MSDSTKLCPWLRRIRSPEDLLRVQQAAARDGTGHSVLAPTHVFERAGAVIIGAASINAVTVLHAWFHTHEMRPRDTACSINQMENVAANLGIRHVLVPCGTTSPIADILPHFQYAKAEGFNRPGAFEWWHKAIREF